MTATRRSRTPLLIAALAIATVIAGCNGGDDDPQTEPTASAGETTQSSSAPTADPTGPLAGYTPEEIAAYHDAVAAVENGRQVEASIYRTAQATPKARRMLESAYTGDYLDTAWQQLRDAEAAGLYTRGRSRVVSSRPLRIIVGGQGATVDLRACVDNASVRVFRRGEGQIESPLSKSAAAKVTVDLGDDDHWRVSRSEGVGRC